MEATAFSIKLILPECGEFFEEHVAFHFFMLDCEAIIILNIQI